MNTRHTLRSFLLLLCLAVMVAAGIALSSSTEAQAKPCCWVYVCGDSGCYHKCVTCPRLP